MLAPDRPLEFALAFGISVPLVVAAILLGHRFELLDRPRPPLKPHGRAVPYLGGSAIVAAMLVLGPLGDVPWTVLAGLLLMWLVGSVDDVRGISPLVKLGAELPPLAVSIAGLGLDPVAALVWIAIGLVLVNAFNVVDGLDGLAGGVALPGLFVLAASPGWGGALAAIAAGATCGFLAFNLRPARIFLADQGSLVIGQVLWLVPLAFFRSQPATAAWVPWVALWLFPIVNSAFVVAARLRGGRSILRGDRSHLYDVINQRAGLTTTLVVCWAIAAVGAVGVLVLA
ncbi:MAG TPA: MraY family glycosyltransferase [Candidatus Limnocylindria bacterium]|nr:MraY family glycosyltransferase [Candidatus Limnocylindria bacterium]